MIPFISGFICPVLAANTYDAALKHYNIMGSALVVLALILGILLICCVVMTAYNIYRSSKHRSIPIVLLIVLYAATAIVLVSTIFCLSRYIAAGRNLPEPPASTKPQVTTQPITSPSTDPSTVPSTTPVTAPPTDPSEETTVPTEPEETEPEPTFTAGHTDNTDPDKYLSMWSVIADGTKVDSYTRPEEITFGKAEEYTAAQGIITFRGDNYRTGATYGTSVVQEAIISTKWTAQLGSFNTWTGAGWTGQPLVVRWDAETKAIMNLYEEKKNKEDLVEVIYATMDGYIRFFDLEDGSATRDPIEMGMNFKGSGSLDPRGYPLMYVGSGDSVPSYSDETTTGARKQPRMYIVSLIDGSILYERSGMDPDNQRWWYAFDGAPLVDAETDTLIWPGENGIIYTMKLSTQYDKAAGTIDVEPEIAAKAVYQVKSGNTIGFESSPIIVGNYLYVGDNGGAFFCIDLNTMEPMWVQDIHDDLNATPVFEWGEDGKGYLYLGTSLEFSEGICYLYKLDAATGEIIWEKIYDDVPFNKDVSGGVLSSPLLGKPGTALEGMIIFHIARCPSYDAGTLVALNTKTGEVIWEETMTKYTWSTPTAIYTDDGNAYIVLCDAAGYMHLIDSATGKSFDKVAVGSNVEASPVVFENMIVVGTRGQQVYGIIIR